MSKKIVAVVGKPNVGKSTFFNKIVGRRISIIEDTPGVTRDRIYADVEWQGHNFTLVDTGGIEPKSDDIIFSQMRLQSEIAINTADVILFMLDGKEQLTTADYEVADMLRKTNKPVIVVVNKLDNYKIPDHFYDYYQLGYGDVISISSINMLNFGDLLDMICSNFSDENENNEEDDDRIKVAIIGKPNVGKSSLVNHLIGEERAIVSDIAGTTRDAIDTMFDIDEDKFTLIDTAGIRRKSKTNERIEKFSVLRALEAIERSDVCVLMIDATEGVTEQDKKIAGYAHEAGRAIVIIVNKWDLIEKDNKTYKNYEKDVYNELSFITYAPVEFVSVKDDKRTNKILELVKYVNNQAAIRVSTGALNDVVSEAVLMHQPPSDKGKRLKLYYMTQVDVKPPRFLLFINDKELAHFSYIRYLENKIRSNFNFDGTRLVIDIKEKNN
ncbi:MAG: ribosome biogenesis GTPase Der [Clostridiales bacterium]|nr:MAG: ribosome biogenesis GTPase Der [Clostridiales bacterium]